jgi:ABC-type cobalamin/Fe3+-siderophores transport system ATPase subunit
VKIIMLSGSNSCGKSSTLNIVHQLLLENNGISTNKQPLGGNKKDFTDIVSYQNQRIAFFTMGDYATHLITAMTNYCNQGIDVLVCTCNNKFVKPYKEIEKYPHHVLTKTLASATISQQAANMADADKIVALI